MGIIATTILLVGLGLCIAFTRGIIELLLLIAGKEKQEEKNAES
jgi:hypothetical protein